MIDIDKFWKAVLEQNDAAIRLYFDDSAYVNWHCTNEHFTVEEFIRANCEYPGEWDGEIENKYVFGDLVITCTQVYLKDNSMSFHVVSFIRCHNDKIISMDEYWGEDGLAPQWRREKHIGTEIKKNRRQEMC